MKLPNYVNGRWVEGAGPGEPLIDPVTGDELARISSQGMDLAAALAFARAHGGPALRQFTYVQRAEMLGKIAEALAANRDEYFRISLLNLGANQADASFDVDGAIYTMKYYAKIGRALVDGTMLKEGAVVSLSKSNVFAGQHFLTPTKGAAVFINAFNFPAWGLCEKAAPALLSGVPVLVKPASPTAWLTHRMVEDIMKGGILPPGAISIVCGSARDLLDHVREEDIVSFTGSADTAARIRSHENVLRRSVRLNIEADSINTAILAPDCTPGADLSDLLVKEVEREMTLKAGQKCTTIRRVMVPRQHFKAFGDAVTARLSSMKVGNPRNPDAKVGPVVNKAQQASCLEGLSKLKEECEVLFGGDKDFQPKRTSHSSFSLDSPSRQEACCALFTTGPTFASGLRGLPTFMELKRAVTASPNALKCWRGTMTRRMVVHFWPALSVISRSTSFTRRSDRSAPGVQSGARMAVLILSASMFNRTERRRTFS